MLHNAMTEKMPCWNCCQWNAMKNSKASEGCKILESFLKNFENSFEKNVKGAISGITFDCSEFKPTLNPR